MKSSKEIVEARALITKKIDDLNAIAEPTAEQKAELRTLITQEDELKEDEAIALRLEKRQIERIQAGAGTKVEDGARKEIEKRFSISKLSSEYAQGKQITGFEKEMVEESEKEARALGVTPSGIYLSNEVMGAAVATTRKAEKRTMTAATDADGGYLIPTEKLEWFDALFDKRLLDTLGVVRLSGLSSNTDIPGITSAVVTGWANGETGTQSPDDPTIANRQLRPKLLYGATNISKRLAIQTNRSVDAMVMQDIMNGLYQALQVAYFNGSGASGQPTGLLNTSGIQSVAMGTDGAAITFAKAMELFAAIASANCNMDNFKWTTNPKVFAKGLQLPIDTGSGAMLITYNGNFGGMPNGIAGYGIGVTASIPSTLTKGSSGAVCSALVGGDHSQGVIAQFGGVDIISDPYTGARSGYTALTVNQWVDIAFKQPAALGAIKDILAG